MTSVTRVRLHEVSMFVVATVVVAMAGAAGLAGCKKDPGGTPATPPVAASPDAAAPTPAPVPPPSPPVTAEGCAQVMPCHGLDNLGCGPAAMCTEMYKMGDFCRQYVKCVFDPVPATCSLAADPKFAECKQCFEACQAGDQNECDAACRKKLGAP